MAIKTYTGDAADVTFDTKRCIHAKECVNRLSAVFDTDKRPWVQPDNATADDLAGVIHRCPSGALHYTRKDGGAAEPTPETNTILLNIDGPLYVRGDVTITLADGDMADTRLALCRCGVSHNKPFCDNSHIEAGFKATESLANPTDAPATGALTVDPAPNGPLLLSGQFTITDANGQAIYRGEQAALCRCGGSGNKPFCDGTHKKIGFTSD